MNKIISFRGTPELDEDVYHNNPSYESMVAGCFIIFVVIACVLTFLYHLEKD